MATKIKLSNGSIHSVYDDALRPLYEALGTITVERATNVEWNHDSQQWVATHIPTNQIIAVGKNRSEVVSQEVAWLERNII